MYEPKNKVRIVTATSLFDGHDASINIMRRIMQASGAEVIHLGHNRTALEVATAAIEEDAQGVAVTCYQGGHMEFFRYLRELLDERGGQDIEIFGGGGGTILPDEGAELLAAGIARIYSPDDGRRLGLQGMIDEIVEACDWRQPGPESSDLDVHDARLLARSISAVENGSPSPAGAADAAATSEALVVGFTGTGGSGKSSLVDEIVRRFVHDFPDRSIALISVDPTRRRSGGALLGDRIRMNSVTHPQVFMRSMATREANRALSPHVADAISLAKAAGFDLVVLESSGIGQSDTEIVDLADISIYVMTPEYGAPTQLEKIDMLDYADLVAINKFDRRGADDAKRDVIKQYRRNRKMFDAADDAIPVFGTIASHFNDPGTNAFYAALMTVVDSSTVRDFAPKEPPPASDAETIIPKARTGYLGDIAAAVRKYNERSDQQATLAGTIAALEVATEVDPESHPIRRDLETLRAQLDASLASALATWEEDAAGYGATRMTYEVRGKPIEVDQFTETLSHNLVPKVAFPRLLGAADRARWIAQENLPGRFPYTAGVYPFRRTQEDPTRMFAGEGTPEQTNRRFHYLSEGMPAKRLSTAFDSVTLYGNDPALRPDIFGKVGNSGVSIATLDDAKKLYSGFDLLDPATSVSMTINGPAPMILAFFMNAAVDQQCEEYIKQEGLEVQVEAALRSRYEDKGLTRPTYHGGLPADHDGRGLMLLGITGADVLPGDIYADIRARTLATVRGTVQADILKEDQAQNTCIFSTEFALRMQGDIQEFFVDHGVRNFYSVSISGYHMAEAGANPISQLAFTLANGFTFVEYFRARGMPVDSFAPNLSFFFSNGLDPEYAVIGRVARRIWAKAMRDVYGGDERSQKLKYHIQTSGRSLHAQEISFNDIRTTLQALYALYDSANSLHTNAYDEAVTTPTEESVRRALAIQLIINKELGLNRTENPMQGSFIIEHLTDLVEGAVLEEFERLSDRGGVLGAMERMYQRTKIQEESLYYERMKESGELPIVGVNTFLSSDGSPFVVPDEVIRSTDDDKHRQIEAVAAVRERSKAAAAVAIEELQRVAVAGENLFAALLVAAQVCSLGQMSDALFDVGGQYRRNA